MLRKFRTLFVVGLLVVASRLFVAESTPSVGNAPSTADLASPADSRPVAGLDPSTESEANGTAADDQEQSPVPVLIASSDELQSEPSVTLYVTGSKVNLRDAPSLKGKTLGQLVEGTLVNRIAEVDGWSEIRTPLGQGWMATRFLSTERPADVQQAEPRRAVAAPSSSEVARAKAEIIRQSIASYPGSCPCPYNSDRAGRRCGGRSAWSRAGGYSPLCYESDISDERLKTYFARLRGAAD
ncbi:SH3 domain-containing protein [Rhodobacter sp. SY28-1]|uniref:SH3 domain-containing protein n=1 Tax=Rhodobacter sp. SY28-1 TaxID=2562317 RepID=UPI003743A43F